MGVQRDVVDAVVAKVELVKNWVVEMDIGVGDAGATCFSCLWVLYLDGKGGAAEDAAGSDIEFKDVADDLPGEAADGVGVWGAGMERGGHALIIAEGVCEESNTTVLSPKSMASLRSTGMGSRGNSGRKIRWILMWRKSPDGMSVGGCGWRIDREEGRSGAWRRDGGTGFAVQKIMRVTVG